MSIEQLKAKFIIEEDVVNRRLESLLTKALQHCAVDKKGTVHINDTRMGGLSKLKLVLAARYLASQLDNAISASVTSTEIAQSSGLPAGQVRARAKDAVGEKFAESVGRGVFRAMPHKIELFLDSLNRDDTSD
jgi:hypothetical protein